jgi:hypothetical protein
MMGLDFLGYTIGLSIFVLCFAIAWVIIRNFGR